MPSQNTKHFDIVELYNQGVKKNITYLIGLNAQGNFDIIDMANSSDMWFHLEDKPSPHIIAKIQDNLTKKELSYIVKQGALLCKSYSKYKSEKKITINYTNISNIKKTNVIGSVDITNYKNIIL
jgi:predicted ribosome quality control (RQC) complex YloA/Tae2 family protein